MAEYGQVGSEGAAAEGPRPRTAAASASGPALAPRTGSRAEPWGEAAAVVVAVELALRGAGPGSGGARAGRGSLGGEPAGIDVATEHLKETRVTRLSGSSETSRMSDSMSVNLSDPRVLRATSVNALLSGFGQYLRDQTALAAAQFSEEESSRSWNKSWQVERIDDFLSHCWSDAGISKAVAMHLYYNGEVAALASISVGSLLVVFRWVEWLPTFEVADQFGQGDHMYYAPWSFFIGNFAFFMTLALGHHMTDNLPVSRVMQRRTVFFDRLCVHQSEPELKDLGISNFAAIVARSRRMVLLWSPRYFTRLWCTLECATLVRIAKRDAGGENILPLVFYPVSIATNTVKLAGTVFVSLAIYTFSLVLGYHRFPAMNFVVIGAILCALSPVYMHSLRRYMRQRMLLSSQMEEFSISNAGCVAETDREKIYQTLRYWFGTPEAFNSVVQTTVREHVMQAIGPECRTSFDTMSLGFLPWVCHQLDLIPVYAGIGGWRGFMLMLQLPAYILWGIAQCQLIHQVAWRTALQRRPCLADLAVSAVAALVWTCLAALQLLPLVLAFYLTEVHSVLGSVARLTVFGFMVALVAVLHYASRL